MANQKWCGRKQFILSQHLPGGNEQNYEKISHDSWSTNLDIIRFHFGLETTKHKTGVTTTWPQIISPSQDCVHTGILLTIRHVRCLTPMCLSLLKILMNFSTSYRRLLYSQLATLLYYKAGGWQMLRHLSLFWSVVHSFSVQHPHKN